jgi:hypothetical protein
MKFLIQLLLFGSSAGAATWSEVYSASRPSIPMILSSGGLCAGALIDNNLILTAAHCVSKLRPAFVSWPEKPEGFERVEVVGMDTYLDLALLKLSPPSSRKSLKLMSKEEKLPEGAPIATIGHPSIGNAFAKPPFDIDMTYLMSAGIVSGHSNSDLISDMSVSPGNSGGPVFNDRGEIAGVVSRKRVDRFVGSIGFVVSARKVHEFLEEIQRRQDLAAPKELSWTKASSTFKFYLATSLHSLLKRDLDSSSWLWYLGFSWDVWDRMRLEAADNFSSNRHYRNYSVGYKFAVDMPNHTVFYLTPSAEYVHYDYYLEDNSLFRSGVWGGGISLLHSSIPLGLKYVGFNINGNYESVLSLQLVL